MKSTTRWAILFQVEPPANWVFRQGFKVNSAGQALAAWDGQEGIPKEVSDYLGATSWPLGTGLGRILEILEGKAVKVSVTGDMKVLAVVDIPDP